MAKPWIQKYLPKKVTDIKGQDKAISEIKKFLENHKKGRSAIIYGPTGTGKTCSVYAIAEELGLEIIEVNASDSRNKKEIETLVGAATKQMSLFSKGKIILLDEIDGLSGTKDRGGIITIDKIIKESKFPIIMTANDPFNSKLSAIRKKSEIIHFHNLNYLSIYSVLKNICKKEKICFDETALKSLSRAVGGDLRAAINDLQVITPKIRLTKKNPSDSSYERILNKKDLEELSHRNKKDGMINALTRIFKTKNPEIAIGAFDEVEEDVDKRFLWIDENLPKEYTKPIDIARAYDYISRADVFKRRIRRWQHWRFLIYINAFLTAGIAVSKKEKYPGFVKYTPTKRILKIWKANMIYQKRNSIAEKYARLTHTSKKESMKNLHYLKAIFKRNNPSSGSIAEELSLDAGEIAWLKK